LGAKLDKNLQISKRTNNIDEIWLYEKGKGRLLFKKNRR
jgi:hypothetical protein